MFQKLLLATICFLLTLTACAQDFPACGQHEITDHLYQLRPQLKEKFKRVEALYAAHVQQKQNGQYRETVSGTVTLPVVVHIIHNNGAENISDAQVRQGIQHLNEAYAHSSYYDGINGVNTGIQFCMAERDPNGRATTGITRNASAYTVMGGSEYYSDDDHVKDLNRWNPDCYINIWLVKSIPGDVVGYAYLPSAAGTGVDGIVMEAAYFGSSSANNIVITHEIGHYLGLYHTFEGGCTNNNCITDGDQVCDTPPDQSTAGVYCNINMNTCTTDDLSGFNSDQNDLKEDFMDYGNFDCMKVFTQGQSDRMNWFIQNVRSSLLHCKSCLPPCPAPVKAIFNASASTVQVSTKVSFTNQSTNAASYLWYIDGQLMDSSFNYAYLFATAGKHIVKLVARSNNELCDDNAYTDTILVTCPVKAAFINPNGIITAGQTSVNFINTSTNASTYTWKVNDVIKSTGTNFSYLFPAPGVYAVTLIAADNLCSDSISYSVSVYDSTGTIPADQCTQTTFQKDYYGGSKDIYNLRPARDGGYLIGGAYYIPGIDSYGGPFAAKINKAGSVQWTKYIMPGSNCHIEKIKETNDGSIIATGFFYDLFTNGFISKAALLKLDANGNLLWVKKLGVSGSKGERGLDVTETADGGYVICGSTKDDEWSGTNWMVAKTDKNGNVMWSKQYDNGFYERAYGIIANGDTLVVTGIRTIPTGPRSEIVITKLNARDGSVIQSKVYDVGNRSVETPSIFKIPGGYLVSAHSIADGFYYADMDLVVLQTDDHLNVVRAGRIYADIFASVHAGISPTPDGGFIAAQEGPNWSVTTDSTSVFMYKINAQWQLEWAKKYTMSFDEGRLNFAPNAVYPTPDKGYILGQNFIQEEQYIQNVRLIKTDINGNTPGCQSDDFQARFEETSFTANDFAWATTGDIGFNDPADPTIHNPVSNTIELTEVQRCETSLCDYLKITGQDSVCNIRDTVTYKATRNAACASFVQWQADTSLASIVDHTDSTIRVVFKKAGHTTFYARIATSCRVLQDSLHVFINSAPAVVNLGPDIALCKQSTTRLSAGSGFSWYKWSDGSVDSTLTAYFPGVYYVSAGDPCGHVYSDTVTITQAPVISLDLGGSISRCDGDTVTIAAPPNFEKYIWTPDYSISSTSAGAVKLWPAVDTTYTLTAQLSNACVAIDTIHVNVLTSRSINIGNDTSFCVGGSALLQAPPGFVSYTWQDGSAASTYSATAQGMYWVKALNANGCFSKDSVVIKEVYPLPNVNLGKDGAVCKEINVLDAGAGFMSYQWQDGTAAPTYAVSDAGNYWVKVTDEHYCTNADTIHITGFLEQPVNFLNPVYEICDHASINIKANGNWQSYLWSNNTTAPVLVASAPGTYWLEITDVHGCKGRDTVQVMLQECPTLIYFPTAFTPNADGKNDVYKPTAEAPLEKYRIIIYNRWGQRLFESSSIAQGWDGTCKNVFSAPGTYIWSVTYKFYNEPEKVKQGTLVLIK